MFQARTQAEIDGLRAGISRVGGLSDSIVKLGPFGIGLDGILAWVPVVGTLYSGAAALTMIVMGWRARVPLSTLIGATSILVMRTTVAAGGEALLLPVLPIGGAAEFMVDLFRAHKWAADMLVKSIDGAVYVEGRRHPSNPDFAEARDRVRSGVERRRIVALG
jgi:hypothetical protein